MECDRRRDKLNPKQPEAFATASLGLSDEGASRLVGSIVEKGISDDNQGSKPFSPIPPPKPTVLPFPVVRHRSHGPHWSPAGNKARGKKFNVQDGLDDEEDERFMDADSIAAFAKPIQRKKKQELEFQRYKELVCRDESASTKKLTGGRWEQRNVEKESENRVTLDRNGMKVLSELPIASIDKATTMEVDNEHSVRNETSTKLSMTQLDIELDHQEIVNHSKAIDFEDSRKSTSLRNPTSGERSLYKKSIGKACSESSPISSVTSSRLDGLGSRQTYSSLESEIDAENRAQLQKMSPEEIAEAQVELMEKMDPALLNLLKKRGQDKFKRQKHSMSATSADRDTIPDSQFSCHDISSQQKQTGTSSASKVIASQHESSAVENSGKSHGLLWDTWTERVEAVRDLRFSLNGDVVEDDSVLATEIGEKRSNFEGAVERDFLRTEGDPGAAGYTIREAIALVRSVVPGQRCLALHLLASVLDKAVCNICQSRVSCSRKDEDIGNNSTDWEAVWAYALGPEPELVLALRLAFDDSHSSVVLACARVIMCLLSCDLNENFFDISEKIARDEKDIFTAPIFRSKPEIDLGFLHGGYWKYSAKPSNILPSRGDIVDDETEDKCTIQDDVYVALQDIAAGLVRMEILPRMYYLLETEPTAALEESIIFILIAIARHSPTSTKAILKFPRLVETIVKRFNVNKGAKVLSSQINSVHFLKVLARLDKGSCLEMVKNGTLDAVTWHLFQFTSSLDSWMKLGKESCKLSSALMVEQLRLWKVCIQKGCCISRFVELFPALCLWLSCPSFETLMERNLMSEFASVAREAYLVLEALAKTLPNIYSQEIPGNDMEVWSWSYVTPMIDMALSWIMSAPELFKRKRGMESDTTSISSLLWVYSALMRTISGVLEKVIVHGEGEPLPWLPEFVPKIGLAIINHRLLSYGAAGDSGYAQDSSGCSSFVESLCCLRQRPKDEELSLASVSCLHGLIQTLVSIQILIQSAKSGMKAPLQDSISSKEESVLAKGILTESLAELRSVWNEFRDLNASEWPLVQSVVVFGRGGPAPGVGLGWGAASGGFWSTRVLLAQADAYLLSLLLHISRMDFVIDSPEDQDPAFMTDKINCALAMCLTAGPRDEILVEKALDFVLQPHALHHLAGCAKSNRRLRAFEWEYTEENYLSMSSVLASHYKHRWLRPKRKSKAESGSSASKKSATCLETIHEESEMSGFCGQSSKSESLIVEWAHQRLPLPLHWFLSAISTVCSGKTPPGLPDALEVTKAGVFFLAGLESVSGLASHPSPVVCVPLVWKIHALSVVLLARMDILEDNMTRKLYEALQEFYCQFLEETRLNCRDTELLRFKSDVHDNYSTFLEKLVEQYAAVSYGDLLYGRQLSVYLHQCVEPSVRLVAWTVLSNACVLELLPSLEKCMGQAKGYLEPVEENEGMLEAYLKSWTSGGLDRAAKRGSVAFTLVLHHFSSLMFCNQAAAKHPLRNKIVKTLLRDYSRKPQREGMMVRLVGYKGMEEEEERMGRKEKEERMEVWKEACEGNTSLISQVETLKAVFIQ